MLASFEQALIILLQGCSNKSDTVTMKQYCYSLVLSTLLQASCNMAVSDLLEQPCIKSDSPIKFVPDLLQQTRNRQSAHNLSTACKQIYSNLFADL